MGLSMDLSETDFKAMTAEYLLILASKFVDDENVYMKHIHRQAQLQNADAMKQVAVLKHFEELDSKVEVMIGDLETLGYERIVNVCRAIQSIPALPFPITQQWSICSLTGVNTNKSVILEFNGQRMHLDEFYAPFASMLWLVSHIQDMEYNRMSEFLARSDPNMSISETMQKYKDELNVCGEAIQNLYYTAFKTVLDVFERTNVEIQEKTKLLMCSHATDAENKEENERKACELFRQYEAAQKFDGKLGW